MRDLQPAGINDDMPLDVEPRFIGGGSSNIGNGFTGA